MTILKRIHFLIIIYLIVLMIIYEDYSIYLGILFSIQKFLKYFENLKI
jgi:hypothetical protein